jgi:uncharacterized protein YjbI with pentapeptide repeats
MAGNLSGFRSSILCSIVLALPIISTPLIAAAVSTLPCPNVGAQTPSTPVLGAGQDNACESWMANQPGTNISGANLTSAALGGNLSTVDFSNTSFVGARMGSFMFFTNYSGAQFTNANFQNASAGYAVYDDAVFTGANLAGASFTQAYLNRANLSGLDLQTTSFFAAKLDDANFSLANLSGNELSGGSSISLLLRLDRTNFTGATMVGSTVRTFSPTTGTTFTSANLTGATLAFGGTDIDFTNAILYQALMQADLRGGSLRNAVLVDADLSSAAIRGTDLTGAFISAGTDLSGTIYDQATLFPSGNTFAGPLWGLPGGASPLDLGMVANFNSADFSGLDYSNVDFLNATMQATLNLATDFTNANLSSCDLRSSQLQGAILAGADLTNANLLYATYDPATIFPSGNNYAVSPWGLPGGVSPWAAGMIPVPEPSLTAASSVGAAAWLLVLCRRRRASGARDRARA